MKKIIEEHFQKEEEYSNLITTFPQSLYESINSETVNQWKVNYYC